MINLDSFVQNLQRGPAIEASAQSLPAKLEM